MKLYSIKNNISQVLYLAVVGKHNLLWNTIWVSALAKQSVLARLKAQAMIL